jgi:hypothetical protein
VPSHRLKFLANTLVALACSLGACRSRVPAAEPVEPVAGAAADGDPHFTALRPDAGGVQRSLSDAPAGVAFASMTPEGTPADAVEQSEWNRRDFGWDMQSPDAGARERRKR